METVRGSRETSVSELLEYEISYNNEGTLQWRPPAGSKELAVALSYQFPEEKDMKEKMRAAIKEFLRNQRKVETEMASEETMKRPFTDAEENNNSRLEMPIRSGLQVLSWNPARKIFEGNRKPTKRRYGKVEGAKVAANRGYVCDFHRKQKSKCDPDSCPRNKQRLQKLARSHDEVARSTIPSNSLPSGDIHRGDSMPSMSNSSDAAQVVNQYVQDDALYLAQTHPESITETGSIDQNYGLSYLAPSSSMPQSQGVDHQGIWSSSSSGPLNASLLLTLPTVIDNGVEHATEINAYGTLPKNGQELFIHNQKNHIADLIKANSDLELEIVALETSWEDFGKRDIQFLSLAGASPVQGVSVAFSTMGISTMGLSSVLMALKIGKAFISNLQPRIQLKQRLERTRLALEKGRAQLKETQEALASLEAARDLQAEIPFLQQEVHDEIALLSKQESS